MTRIGLSNIQISTDEKVFNTLDKLQEININFESNEDYSWLGDITKPCKLDFKFSNKYITSKIFHIKSKKKRITKKYFKKYIKLIVGEIE